MKTIIIALSLLALTSTGFAAKLSEKTCLELKASHEKSIKELNDLYQKGELTDKELASEVWDSNVEAELYNKICPQSVRFQLIN